MSEIKDSSSFDSSASNNRTDLPSGRPSVGYSLWLTIVLLTIFFFLGLGTGYLVWGQTLIALNERVESLQARAEGGNSTSREGGAGTQNPQQALDGLDAPRQVVRYPVSEDGNPSFGPDNAPITIIEFSDYECPYCISWHTQVWPLLIEAYPDQIRLVYRDFPLSSIHPNAAPAAEAAYCAREQDRFWEFHELLFSGGQALGKAAYLSYASEMGLDLDQFTRCLDEERYAADVDANFQYALQLGVQSTPTFFINGIALIGAQPFEVFQEIIELELAGKLSK